MAHPFEHCVEISNGDGSSLLTMRWTRQIWMKGNTEPEPNVAVPMGVVCYRWAGGGVARHDEAADEGGVAVPGHSPADEAYEGRCGGVSDGESGGRKVG